MTYYSDKLLQEQLTDHFLNHPAGTGGGGSGFVTGSGMFSGHTGTTIIHNIGLSNHCTLVTPGGGSAYDADTISKIGNIYVEYGSDQDIVYNTGGTLSSGISFIWAATASGVTISGACAECTDDGLIIIGNVTAASGIFTDGIQVGSGTVYMLPDGFKLSDGTVISTANDLGAAGDVTQEELTTTSGAIVSYVNEQLSTMSGGELDYIYVSIESNVNISACWDLSNPILWNDGTVVESITLTSGNWFLGYDLVVYMESGPTASEHVDCTFWMEDGSSVILEASTGTAVRPASSSQHFIYGVSRLFPITVTGTTTYTLRGLKYNADDDNPVSVRGRTTSTDWGMCNSSLIAISRDYKYLPGNGGTGDVTTEMLTTTSGDIIGQIPSYIEAVNRTMVGGRLEKYSDTELRWEAYGHYSIGLYNGSYWLKRSNMTF